MATSTQIAQQQANEQERANKAREAEDKRRNTLGAISNTISAVGSFLGPVGRVVSGVVSGGINRAINKDKQKSEDARLKQKLDYEKTKELSKTSRDPGKSNTNTAKGGKSYGKEE